MTTVSFPLAVYSLDTLKRAAYRLTHQASFSFQVTDEMVICTLSPLSSGATFVSDDLIQSFQNEVLDQDLRQTIAEETSVMRNIILAHVFSKTGLQSHE